MSVTRFPDPLRVDSAVVPSVNVTVPVPVYRVRSAGDVSTMLDVSLADCGSNVFPLVPPKSITPSNAVASNVAPSSLRATSSAVPTPGPVRVTSPATVVSIVVGRKSLLSTLNSVVNSTALVTSTDVSVPRAGSNWGRSAESVQLVRRSGKSVVYVRRTGSPASSTGVATTSARLVYCPTSAVPVASYVHVSPTSRMPLLLSSPPCRTGITPWSSVNVTSPRPMLPVLATS